MFRHPSYYKKLKASQVKKSDQVISPRAATAGTGVHPGPGLKLRHGGLTPEASGDKHQASSAKLLEKRATSIKRQA